MIEPNQQAQAWLNRRARNRVAKVLKAAQRARDARIDLIALGRTVVVTEIDGVKRYSIPTLPKSHERAIAHLTWINAKTSSRFADRRHQPGRKPEHVAAMLDFFAVKERYEPRPNLQDHQGEVPVVATGATEA
jgi:hypothetical protein